jgi:hypothetical protein
LQRVQFIDLALKVPPIALSVLSANFGDAAVSSAKKV